MMDTFNSPETVSRLKRDYGASFHSCRCGREEVLLYKRAENWPRDFSHNGRRADRFTYHDTPKGVACAFGGMLLVEALGLWTK